jgi:hypothetical protein
MEVAQGVLPPELLQHADDFLRFWKIILPTPSMLGRLAAAVGSTGRQEILDGSKWAMCRSVRGGKQKLGRVFRRR